MMRLRFGRTSSVGLVQALKIFVSSNDFKRVLVDYASTSPADVPVRRPVLRGWLNLVALAIAGEEAVTYRPIAADA